ncbi:hypothetical protein SPRG_09848 [Saprolegnia parasitica CBS 223.65]|uniref:Uncharacterized protein n=1 Tax=Saprolegnia parasitica (strain CBS 223.65) TaxID=695850 RepID=A0A067CD34_SAPPC|nr:hypothetical protein SPRG_09848 [Saprolegnia parasitica CBS 223.65]KDO24466.1 hypothetical protein SPRG_09848 [Saprolegnia parasitica CBS 223.65]|eukprot:XP_012204887.1 hypothetical protein SPRG_09848 [Saprolegnia parasitica CBS 223.65]
MITAGATSRSRSSARTTGAPTETDATAFGAATGQVQRALTKSKTAVLPDVDLSANTLWLLPCASAPADAASAVEGSAAPATAAADKDEAIVRADAADDKKDELVVARAKYDALQAQHDALRAQHTQLEQATNESQQLHSSQIEFIKAAPRSKATQPTPPTLHRQPGPRARL